MKLTSEEVLVVDRGLYNPENERMGEFIRVQAEGDSETRRYTLDKSVNGEVVVGQKAKLQLESRMRPQARTSRDGEQYVQFVEKLRVVGVAK